MYSSSQATTRRHAAGEAVNGESTCSPIQKPTPHAVMKNSTYNFQNMSLGYAVGLYVDLLHFESPQCPSDSDAMQPPRRHIL